MTSYYNYYDTFPSSPLNNMNGGELFDNDNLATYILLAVMVIAIIYVVREMNNRYDKLLNNISQQRTQLIQLPLQMPQQQTQQTQKTQQNVQQEFIEQEQEQNQIEPQVSGHLKVNVHKINREVPFFPRKTAFDLMREYDYRTLNDPLVAPRRRDDFNLPVLPLPTRGYPAAYKKVGLLVDRKAHDNDRYKFLILMGRNTHPGSYHFEYYAAENDKAGVLKFNVSKRGKQELQTDDKVKIDELDRTYSVVIDRILGYEYDPYLY